jgi:hypothetical protein
MTMTTAAPCARVLSLFPAAAGLEVPSSLAQGWTRIGVAARSHVTAYLAGAAIAGGVVVATGDVPPTFAADLAVGAPQLRAAFPGLRRRVVALEARGGRAIVRVACYGLHGGAFFGFMAPTGRPVAFDEEHALVLDGDHVAVDHLALDLRAIIRQMAGPRSRMLAAAPLPLATAPAK